jgi:glutamyl-tRNA synthetase
MSSTPPVVTRLAPSPTGSMHIGTARTALFNWLYARHTGGTFLLRIEDTDRERSTESAVQVIFDGLDWLGLTPDAPPVFQSKQADRHREVVQQLFDAGHAYRCYMAGEELEAARARAREQGKALRSPWRDREAAPGDKAPYVLRFKAPSEGETVLNDMIKGVITFANDQLDDLVLLRSDGAPTYNLAVVVDDHDMGITHIIRGDDHVSNAARQSQLYAAMGWTLPAFAHLPLIHGPDGAKLSKRHGAQAASDFADMGYLPEAMRNYLARLGWGHGDDEIFSDAQAIEWFDVKDVGSSPARLDWAKLNHVNQHYIQLADDARLLGFVAGILAQRDIVLSPAAEARVLAAMPVVKEGAQTLVQLADLCVFAIAERPLALPEEPSAKLLTPETRARLGRLAAHLGAVDWSKGEIEAAIRAFAEAETVGIGKFGPALRLVLGGGAPAPDLASTLLTFGREDSLARISDAAAPPA